MKFELWSYDEYGQGSILTSGDLKTVLDKAKATVTEANVDNQLAGGEKGKHWEAFFPQVIKGSKVNPNVLYAGNKRNGTHQVLVKTKDKWSLSPLDDRTVNFYLGEINKQPWYLADHKNKLITSFDDQALERKTIIFVKLIEN